jgi:hypothetical protein
MGIAARLTLEPGTAVDRAPPRTVAADATMRDAGGYANDVVVLDLSRSGCLVETPTELGIGALVRIGIAGIPSVPGRIVRQTGKRYGCEFLDPLTAEEVETAGALQTVHWGEFDAAPQRSPVRSMATLVFLVGLPWIIAGGLALKLFG